jgi:site-specific recombinase XerD
MTLLAHTLQLFFTERLANQRPASPATITSYRNTFRLLLRFMQDRTGKPPSQLDWTDLDAGAISAFLDHLQTARRNSARSRNTRLPALGSLFRFAAPHHPEHADPIQHVLAIPQKRFDKTIVSFLEPAEIDALLAAPDRRRWEGRRDHALLVLAVQTELRLFELTGLNCGDIAFGPGAHVRCTGKGRKQRCVPIAAATTAILRPWLTERAGAGDEPAFPTRTGRRLSNDAVEARLATHTSVAQQRCAALVTKRVTPQTLRHTCAMTLLRSGVDVAVIALWLGHSDSRSTNAYLHADMTIKVRALARTTPPATKPG